MQQPNQPAITPAYIAAAIIALIAPLADLLHLFGVYDLSVAQQNALGRFALALAGFAAVLVAADAALRVGRNKARATIAAAAPAAAPTAGLVSQPQAFSGTRSKVELSASPKPTLSVTNTSAPATAPVTEPPEPEAPFTADGERVTVGDFETYPLESFVADPKDRHGANDTPAEVTP